MTKTAFLERLRRELHGLAEADIQSSLDFWSEMIDERMDAGMTEKEAVAALDDPADIAREILLDLPLSKVIRRKHIRRRTLRAREIVLLALGSPIWLSLLIAAGAILLSVYIVLWAVVVSLWATDAALAGASVGVMVSGIVCTVQGAWPSGLLGVGAALITAGLAVAGFVGCAKLTALTAKWTTAFGRWIKSLFISTTPPKEKEEAV